MYAHVLHIKNKDITCSRLVYSMEFLSEWKMILIYCCRFVLLLTSEMSNEKLTEMGID